MSFEEQHTYSSFLDLKHVASSEYDCAVHSLTVFCIHEYRFHAYM